MLMLSPSHIYYLFDASPWPLFVSRTIYYLALCIVFSVLVFVVIADVWYRFLFFVNTFVWEKYFTVFRLFYYFYSSIHNFSVYVMYLQPLVKRFRIIFSEVSTLPLLSTGALVVEENSSIFFMLLFFFTPIFMISVISRVFRILKKAEEIKTPLIIPSNATKQLFLPYSSGAKTNPFVAQICNASNFARDVVYNATNPLQKITNILGLHVLNKPWYFHKWFVKNAAPNIQALLISNKYYESLKTLDQTLPKNLRLSDYVSTVLTITTIDLLKNNYPPELVYLYHYLLIASAQNRGNIEFLMKHVPKFNDKFNFYSCLSPEIKKFLIPVYSQSLRPIKMTHVEEEIAISVYNSNNVTHPLKIAKETESPKENDINLAGNEIPTVIYCCINKMVKLTILMSKTWIL